MPWYRHRIQIGLEAQVPGGMMVHLKTLRAQLLIRLGELRDLCQVVHPQTAQPHHLRSRRSAHLLEGCEHAVSIMRV